MLTTAEVSRRRLAFLMSERARKIGGRLTEKREELGLSRSAMARRFRESAVTDDYLYRWEAGRVEPSDSYMPSILEAYEIESVADLYAGPVAERPEPEETPDLMPSLNGSTGEVLQRLTALEEKVDRLVDALLPTSGAAPEPKDAPSKLPQTPGPRRAEGHGQPGQSRGG